MAKSTKQADTTMLAGTFMAWRVILGVLPEELFAVFKVCEENCLQPSLNSLVNNKPFGVKDRISVTVTVPVISCPNPAKIVTETLKDFDVATLRGKEVKLICPPKPIPWAGVCSHCGTIFSLVNLESRPDGPKKDKLVLTVHESDSYCCNGNGHNGVCPGSGFPATEWKGT
ncbi:MAG: hypothetical protein WCK10_00655 [Candidatus Staskawiczbacteria bacterium]